MNNEMTYINVEVETLNLENVKNDLLDYVDKNAKIDITESVKASKKSALDAEVSAINAANSAILASEYASQTIADLEQYYSKNQTDELLAGKANIANTLTGYGITDAYTKSEVDTALSGKQNSLSSAQLNAVNSGITSAKVTQYDGYATGKANTGLDNLSSDGQMVIDSQNGTISNCILDIPQNLKLELSNNVLTLKSGSVLALVDRSIYTTVTTTQDYSITYTNQNGTFFIIFTGTGITGTWTSVSNLGSGTSLPADNSQYSMFFLISNGYGTYYNWNAIINDWSKWNVDGSYPLAIVNVVNGVASFAKDSNGNDLIFNGAGFIGHHAFVYPNVSGLIPDGINTDGSMKSVLLNSSRMTILDLASNLSNFTICYRSNGYVYNDEYYVVDTKDDFIVKNYTRQYVKSDNMIYTVSVSGGVITGYNQYEGLHFITYSTDANGVVTDFTIRQPIRTATVEMVEKKADDSSVVKLTGNQTVAGVKTFTSNPVISSTQPQIQFVDSDFSKGTVPLSALRNTFFVLRDSSNLESGNIGTFYQRVDEYGNNYIAIVAFKNASGSNDNAQIGIYYNVDGTSYATCPTPPAGDNSIKIATTKWVNDYFASITGYDATKTQTLKNVSGTLTWVDD